MPDRQLRTLRRPMAALAVGLLVSALAAAPARADDPAFTISDDRISAPTGLATDSATSSYWIVNAEGGRIFALSRTGRLKGTVDYRATPTDVQAVSYRSGRLYVGDIGDPDRNREMISVFLFPNLTPESGTVTYQSWDFRYPDGPRDAKAMLVDTAGRLFIITTGDQPGIYAAPTSPSRQNVNELERVADAPGGVTDAVALTAERWVLRTATSAQQIDAATRKAVAESTLPVKDGDTLGIDLADRDGLVAGSAGASAAVYAVGAPSGQPAKPSATARPSAGASATANGDEPSEDVASDSSRSGTWLALGLAALLALVAGLVAYLWPSRRPAGARALPAETPSSPDEPADPADVSAPRRPATTPSAGATVASDWRPAASAPSSGSAGSPGWPEDYTPARASVDPDRHRPPGDIEDDDDSVEDTAVRAGPLPPRRADPGARVSNDPAARRSLGYDPDLWGDEVLGRRTAEPPRRSGEPDPG